MEHLKEMWRPTHHVLDHTEYKIHDGMRAGVRTGDGEVSEWFAIEQGLHHGCIIALLLFNTFFAAALHVPLTKFNSDYDILRNLLRVWKRE